MFTKRLSRGNCGEPDEAGFAAGSGGTDGQGRESNDRVAVRNRQGWRDGRHHPSSARVQPGLDAFNPGSWGDFRPLVEDGFKGFVTSTKPEDALEHLNDFRVLCALRSGAYGADRINDYILKVLAGSAAHPSCPVPLMITKNDRSLGVANGDVGVLMPDKPHELFLPVEDGSCRMVRVELLDSTEVAFATTIHKSQGSEFNDVAIVLPPEGESPLLTREILYTGITRTRKTVHVYAGAASIRKCCEKTVERVSGLV